jgi:hypothetical protein
MAKERFVYRGSQRTVESVVKKSKSGGDLYDSYLVSEAQMFKPKEGENVVRIMPPSWKDTEKYGDGWEVGIYLHYNVGPDDGSYLCLDKMKGEPCPVCDARSQSRSEEEKDALRPSFRCLAWVIDRDNEKAGPLVWSMPITLFKDINARSIDKKSNLPILIDDPEEGFDIAFNREGTDMRTKYTAVEVLRDASPLHDDERLQERWLNYITQLTLPDLLNFYSPEHIEKVLFGRADRRSTETEETVSERPARSRREAPVEETEDPSPRRGRRAEAEPETEDPRGERVSRRRALLDDPQDSEPETPRRGTRAAPKGDLDDEIPFEETEEGTERPSRRASEAAGEGSPVEQARDRLKRLKPRGRAS